MVDEVALGEVGVDELGAQYVRRGNSTASVLGDISLEYWTPGRSGAIKSDMFDFFSSD